MVLYPLALVNPTEMATTSAGSPAKDQKERGLVLLPSKPASTLCLLLPALGMGRGAGKLGPRRPERGCAEQERGTGGGRGREPTGCRHGGQTANEMQDA